MFSLFATYILARDNTPTTGQSICIAAVGGESGLHITL